MRKLNVYLLFVAVAVVIVSIYGVAHHQVTWSVSPEYYTKFKFIQTNLADTLASQHMTQPRSAVVIAGVKTSWAIGLGIGIIIGLIALIFPTSDTMFPSALQALGITILVSAITALICYYTNPNNHIGAGIYDTMPARRENLNNIGAFFRAASIQYGALLGYIFGLAAALLFLLIKNSRLRRNLNPNTKEEV